MSSQESCETSIPSNVAESYFPERIKAVNCVFQIYLYLDYLFYEAQNFLFTQSHTSVAVVLTFFKYEHSVTVVARMCRWIVLQIIVCCISICFVFTFTICSSVALCLGAYMNSNFRVLLNSIHCIKLRYNYFFKSWNTLSLWPHTCKLTCIRRYVIEFNRICAIHRTWGEFYFSFTMILKIVHIHIHVCIFIHIYIDVNTYSHSHIRLLLLLYQ